MNKCLDCGIEVPDGIKKCEQCNIKGIVLGPPRGRSSQIVNRGDVYQPYVDQVNIQMETEKKCKCNNIISENNRSLVCQKCGEQFCEVCEGFYRKRKRSSHDELFCKNCYEIHKETLKKQSRELDSKIKKSLEYISLSDDEHALELIEEVLSTFPYIMNASVIKMDCLFRLHRDIELIEFCDDILEKYPDCYYCWMRKGSVTEDPIEAIKYYDRALKINPKCTQALVNKGITLINNKSGEEGIECLDAALDLDPDDQDIWYLKGQIYYSNNQYSDAIKFIDKGLQLDPMNQEGWISLGNALIMDERLQEAEDCYSKAIDIDSNNDYSWYMKGVSLRIRGKNEDALNCFNKAISIDEEPPYLYSKASTLEDLGRQDEANKVRNALGTKEEDSSNDTLEELLKQMIGG
jgi:tetratricopeptide (TPR) repeat protein